MYSFVHAYMHPCMHAYIEAYMHAYLHTDIPTYRHTDIHTCRHTYIHTYMIHLLSHLYDLLSGLPNLSSEVLVFRSFAVATTPESAHTV